MKFINIDKEDLSIIIKEINKIKINKTWNRKNSGVGRSQTLGLVRNLGNRFYKLPQIVNSVFTNKHPELYDKVKSFGKKYCPFNYTSIQVNHNYNCKKHRDKGNDGDSLLIVFGEYEGGKLVIEDKKIDMKNKGIIFNGSKLYHWVEEIESGNRYSLVFFNIKN